MELSALINTMEAVEMRHPALRDPSRNPVVVYLASLGPGSRRTMTHGLRVVAEILAKKPFDPTTIPWWKLQYQHIQAIRTILADRYAHSTANKILSALRGVLRETWRLGYIDGEKFHRITDIKAVPGETVMAGRKLEPGELLALVNACMGDEGPSGTRDAAILGLLYAGGLRRSEVVALDYGDIDLEGGQVTVRHSKGNKSRVVYFPRAAIVLLVPDRMLPGAGFSFFVDAAARCFPVLDHAGWTVWPQATLTGRRWAHFRLLGAGKAAVWAHAQASSRHRVRTSSNRSNIHAATLRMTAPAWRTTLPAV